VRLRNEQASVVQHAPKARDILSILV